MTIFIANEIFANPNKTFVYQTTEEDIKNKEEIEIIGDVPNGAKVEIKGLECDLNPMLGNITMESDSIILSDFFISRQGDLKLNSVKIGDNTSITGIQIMTRGCVNLIIIGNVKEDAKILSESDVTVSCDVTAGGDVEKGAVIKTSMGEINAINVSGAELSARDGINISGTVSDNSILESSTDDIKAASVHGEKLKARGDIVIDGIVSGNLILESSTGKIKVDTAYKGVEFKQSGQKKPKIKNDFRDREYPGTPDTSLTYANSASVRASYSR